ncbi:MAG: hypothetical protein GF313_13225 [Caldithrix sp.]|nr:hypothetical protein [Caldithrix sp.]
MPSKFFTYFDLNQLHFHAHFGDGSRLDIMRFLARQAAVNQLSALMAFQKAHPYPLDGNVMISSEPAIIKHRIKEEGQGPFYITPAIKEQVLQPYSRKAVQTLLEQLTSSDHFFWTLDNLNESIIRFIKKMKGQLVYSLSFKNLSDLFKNMDLNHADSSTLSTIIKKKLFPEWHLLESLSEAQKKCVITDVDVIFDENIIIPFARRCKELTSMTVYLVSFNQSKIKAVK